MFVVTSPGAGGGLGRRCGRSPGSRRPAARTAAAIVVATPLISSIRVVMLPIAVRPPARSRPGSRRDLARDLVGGPRGLGGQRPSPRRPRPRSPGRPRRRAAASMVALRASRLVWPAIAADQRHHVPDLQSPPRSGPATSRTVCARPRRPRPARAALSPGPAARSPARSCRALRPPRPPCRTLEAASSAPAATVVDWPAVSRGRWRPARWAVACSSVAAAGRPCSTMPPTACSKALARSAVTRLRSRFGGGLGVRLLPGRRPAPAPAGASAQLQHRPPDQPDLVRRRASGTSAPRNRPPPMSPMVRPSARIGLPTRRCSAPKTTARIRSARRGPRCRSASRAPDRRRP